MLVRAPTLRLVVAVILLGSAAANAQFPVLNVTSASRNVLAEVSASGFNDTQDMDSFSLGPFAEIVAAAADDMKGTSGFSAASQNTSIQIFSIAGVGAGDAETVVVNPGSSTTLGQTEGSVTFTLPIDASFSLSGSVDSSRQGSEGAGIATISMAGTDANGAIFVLSQSSTSNQIFHDGLVEFDLAGTIKANTMVELIFAASASTGVAAVGSHSAHAEFDFVFDLGDRDRDGLLDGWETEGIDIDGMPPIDIDLPNLGADPDRKDLFVEVDVMSGVAYDQTAIDMVKRAFAEAPVDNGKGVGLHVIEDDGDSIGQQAIVDPFVGMPSQFQLLKAAFFGSASDRARSDWGELRYFRGLIFRYCLWVDTIEAGGEVFLGLAEGGGVHVAGNDFAVAAGYIASNLASISKSTAGVFMHELGHALNLNHGGGDGINFKPNYLSVMNYAYNVPFAVDVPQTVGDYWRLDYSRTKPMTLDENSLSESDGLDGPAGRVIFFNTTLGNAPDPVIAIAWANSPTIDWNNSRTLNPGTIQTDLNRWGAGETPNLTMLPAYTDWDRLWYPVFGDQDFQDRSDQGGQPATFEGIPVSIIEEIEALEWVDQTALGDLVFSNGFELGSTTAWSATVP